VHFPTTHAGSLPRPPELVAMLVRQSRREPVDPGALEAAVAEATRRCVERQLEVGIDIGNDGEQARESFFTYVQHRMSGFGGSALRPPMRDIVEFPSFLRLFLRGFERGDSVNLGAPPQIVGPIRYADRGPLERECAAFRRALAGAPRPFAEAFWTVPSPGIIAAAMPDAHYGSLDACLRDIADALRVEYEYAAEQGFLVQVDAPDLAMERHTRFADAPLAAFLAFAERVVEELGRALERVPRERVRLHVCWGNYEAPHHRDVPLEEILPILYRAPVGALVLSMANPRHAHEVRCFERHPLPEPMRLVAGVIDTTTNYVEHPEVVADRLERAARAVGDPARVVAGTDCGFATAAGFGEVAEEVVWEKLRALRSGADLAASRLG
jgi:5-methyltetrahydropteroyltriglutamate--homocysteine methyltransferase